MIISLQHHQRKCSQSSKLRSGLLLDILHIFGYCCGWPFHFAISSVYVMFVHLICILPPLNSAIGFSSFYFLNFIFNFYLFILYFR